jgi:hypothetical protein
MASNQKKLDIATIVIIIISIILILSGFFLLNKNYAKKNNQNIGPVSQSSISLSNLEKSSSSSSTKSSVILSSSSQVSESSSSSSSSISSSTASSISSREKSKLKTSEAIIKVIAIDNSKYEVEVIDTGYENGKTWKIGSKIKIGVIDFKAQIDKEYKLSGISETNNSYSFDLITENK